MDGVNFCSRTDLDRDSLGVTNMMHIPNQVVKGTNSNIFRLVQVSRNTLYMDGSQFLWCVSGFLVGTAFPSHGFATN